MILTFVDHLTGSDIDLNPRISFFVILVPISYFHFGHRMYLKITQLDNYFVNWSFIRLFDGIIIISIFIPNSYLPVLLFSTLFCP
jgi:hypothetical protein